MSYNGPQDLDAVLNLWEGRVRNEYHNVVPWFGTTGNGKSDLALAVCLELDKGFDVDKDVVFTAQQWIKRSREKDYYGAAILLDEATNGASAKESQTHIGRLVSNHLNVVRKKRQHHMMLYPLWLEAAPSVKRHAKEVMHKRRRTSVRFGQIFPLGRFEKQFYSITWRWEQKGLGSIKAKHPDIWDRYMERADEPLRTADEYQAMLRRRRLLAEELPKMLRPL